MPLIPTALFCIVDFKISPPQSWPAKIIGQAIILILKHIWKKVRSVLDFDNNLERKSSDYNTIDNLK